MTSSRAVTVKKFPEMVSGEQARQFRRELAAILDRDRPSVVFDFSELRQLDSAGIDLLMHCMEEAMKRNGDIKLAAVSSQAAVILELTRVDRLFEIFESSSDAVESFYRFPVEAFRRTESPAGAKEYGSIS